MSRGVNAGFAGLHRLARREPATRWPSQRLFRRRAGEHRFGMSDMLVALAFGGVVIAAGVIGHGAVVIAVCSAVGAGEMFHRVSEIGVGITQAFGRTGGAESAL